MESNKTEKFGRSDEIMKYIRGEELGNGEKYKLFSLDGGIKREYCERGADDSTMSQLRKFYDQIVAIHDKLSRGFKSKDVADDLIRIVPVARYAYARSLIREELVELINRSIDTITKSKNEEDFKKTLDRFKNVMEAIVAYSKKEKKQGGRE